MGGLKKIRGRTWKFLLLRCISGRKPDIVSAPLRMPPPNVSVPPPYYNPSSSRTLINVPVVDFSVPPPVKPPRRGDARREATCKGIASLLRTVYGPENKPSVPLGNEQSPNKTSPVKEVPKPEPSVFQQRTGSPDVPLATNTDAKEVVLPAVVPEAIVSKAEVPKKEAANDKLVVKETKILGSEKTVQGNEKSPNETIPVKKDTKPKPSVPQQSTESPDVPSATIAEAKKVVSPAVVSKSEVPGKRPVDKQVVKESKMLESEKTLKEPNHESAEPKDASEISSASASMTGASTENEIEPVTEVHSIEIKIPASDPSQVVHATCEDVPKKMDISQVIEASKETNFSEHVDNAKDTSMAIDDIPLGGESEEAVHEDKIKNNVEEKELYVAETSIIETDVPSALKVEIEKPQDCPVVHKLTTENSTEPKEDLSEGTIPIKDTEKDVTSSEIVDCTSKEIEATFAVASSVKVVDLTADEPVQIVDLSTDEPMQVVDLSVDEPLQLVDLSADEPMDTADSEPTDKLTNTSTSKIEFKNTRCEAVETENVNIPSNNPNIEVSSDLINSADIPNTNSQSEQELEICDIDNTNNTPSQLEPNSEPADISTISNEGLNTMPTLSCSIDVAHDKLSQLQSNLELSLSSDTPDVMPSFQGRQTPPTLSCNTDGKSAEQIGINHCEIESTEIPSIQALPVNAESLPDSINAATSSDKINLVTTDDGCSELALDESSDLAIGAADVHQVPTVSEEVIDDCGEQVPTSKVESLKENMNEGNIISEKQEEVTMPQDVLSRKTAVLTDIHLASEDPLSAGAACENAASLPTFRQDLVEEMDLEKEYKACPLSVKEIANEETEIENPSSQAALEVAYEKDLQLEPAKPVIEEKCSKEPPADKSYDLLRMIYDWDLEPLKVSPGNENLSILPGSISVSDPESTSTLEKQDSVDACLEDSTQEVGKVEAKSRTIDARVLENINTPEETSILKEDPPGKI